MVAPSSERAVATAPSPGSLRCDSASHFGCLVPSRSTTQKIRSSAKPWVPSLALWTCRHKPAAGVAEDRIVLATSQNSLTRGDSTRGNDWRCTLYREVGAAWAYVCSVATLSLGTCSEALPRDAEMSAHLHALASLDRIHPQSSNRRRHSVAGRRGRVSRVACTGAPAAGAGAAVPVHTSILVPRSF